MSYPRFVYQGSILVRYKLARAATGLSLLFLLAASCPSPDLPPPPALPAPTVNQPSIVATRVQDRVRETVRLHWTSPATESLGVFQYTVLRRIDDDSVFSIPRFGSSIPDSVTDFYDLCEDIGFPIGYPYKKIYYRIVAIDSLDRPSDTSATCSLQLAWQPILNNPQNGDTLGTNLFSWTVSAVQNLFYTKMMVWNSSRQIYISRREQFTGSEHSSVRTDNTLPDSCMPLAPGTYYFAAWYQVIDNDLIESMKVGTFFVR